MSFIAKYISGADIVPGTSRGGIAIPLECSGELVKKIITRLAIEFS